MYIDRSLRSDQGTYYCTASNVVGTNSAPAQLYVVGAEREYTLNSVTFRGRVYLLVTYLKVVVGYQSVRARFRFSLDMIFFQL